MTERPSCNLSDAKNINKLICVSVSRNIVKVKPKIDVVKTKLFLVLRKGDSGQTKVWCCHTMSYPQTCNIATRSAWTVPKLKSHAHYNSAHVISCDRVEATHKQMPKQSLSNKSIKQLAGNGTNVITPFEAVHFNNTPIWLDEKVPTWRVDSLARWHVQGVEGQIQLWERHLQLCKGLKKCTCHFKEIVLQLRGAIGLFGYMMLLHLLVPSLWPLTSLHLSSDRNSVAGMNWFWRNKAC